MRTDNAVKTAGIEFLFEGLGIVDAERFISLIIKKSYTPKYADLYKLRKKKGPIFA